MGFWSSLRNSQRGLIEKAPTIEDPETGENALREFEMIRKFGDNEVGAFDLPENINGISDHITNHPKFQEFPYVTVVDSAKENLTDVVNRLHNSMPSVDKSTLPTTKFPPRNLIEKTESVLVKDLLVSGDKRKTSIKIKKPYLLLKEVIINYVPLGPINHRFSQYICCLHDDRLVEETVVNAFVANTNTSNSCRFGLDYCIPSSCIDMLKLSFTCNYKAVIDGLAWATISICVTAAELNMPVQISVQRVHGVLQLPDSALRKHKTNPKMASVAFRNVDMDELKNMYERGELKDVQKPNTSKYKKTVAGTEMNYSDRGQRSSAQNRESDPIKENVMDRFLRGDMPDGRYGGTPPGSDVSSTRGKSPVESINEEEIGQEQIIEEREVVEEVFTPINPPPAFQTDLLIRGSHKGKEPMRYHSTSSSLHKKTNKKGRNKKVSFGTGDYETYAF